MNRIQTFLALRKNIRLSERRNALYEANRTAKILMSFGVIGIIIYMMFIAVIISLLANESRFFTAPQFFFSLLPFVLVLDFVFRLFAQQTPAQLIRPYLLLPFRRYDCIDSFLMSCILSYNNFPWLFVTVPFVLMSVVFGYGLAVAVNLVVVFQIIIICNSLFYMLSRSLVVKKIYFVVLPLLVYGILFLPLLFNGFSTFFSVFAVIGETLVSKSMLLYFLCFLSVVVLYSINRIVQYRCIISEAKCESESSVTNFEALNILDRYKATGEFLKIEIKMMLRNKNIRQTFIYQMLFVVVLSLLNSFTEIYNDEFSTYFWAAYPFTLVCINLVRIMRPEGNYIECLMVHKENIKELLLAKYYFYTSLLLLPFIIMLPTVFTGKYSILMLISLMVFTAGPVFCMMMQLAVYNKQTMPLNTKLTRQNGLETNFMQILIEMVALFLPVMALPLLQLLFGDILTYLLVMSVGILFIAFHRYWISNIYVRMMRRKYENLEGFMTSR